MTTTETTTEPARAAVVRYTPPADNSTLALAPEAWKLATKLTGTDFVPEALRNNPEATLACILSGHELGIGPMQALQKIHVIKGRPALSAELMRALILAAGHEIWIEEASTTRVILKASRRGSERVSTVTWTQADAERAKLWGTNNWRTYPRAMLLARASSEMGRLLFADVLAGFSHTAEELTDGEEAVGDDLFGRPEVVEASSSQVPAGESPPPTVHKAARAATAAQGAGDPGEIPAEPAPVGEVPDLPVDDGIIEAEIIEPEIVVPEGEQEAIAEELDNIVDTIDERHGGPVDPAEELDDALEAEVVDPLPESDDPWPDDDDPPNETDPGATYTGPQLIAMKLGNLGVKDRPAKLRAVEQILGLDEHTLDTSNDLSSEQCATVLDYLERQPEGVTLIVDEPPPEPEPEPAPRKEAVTPVEEWDGDRWREFLKRRKVKVAPAMREAQRLAHELDEPVTIATIDDIRGSGIEADLVGWIEEQ